MKKYFIVSLVKNGILGGGIVADSEAITYHTGKLTIPQEYRHLVMKYEDISEVAKGWFFILPTVTEKCVTETNTNLLCFSAESVLLILSRIWG